jgi:hypothetical protein
MNHNEALLIIGADPSATSAELSEHLAGCPECAQFQREMVTLDNDIRRALEQGPLGTAAELTGAAPAQVATSVTPITDAPKTRRSKRAKVWSGWALAASVAVASMLAVWLLRPSESLAHDVVEHVEYESGSWTSHEQISPAAVKKALAKAGAELDLSSDKIMYAHSCVFHGHVVPHLVVTTPSGPVTVMVLPEEHVKQRVAFHEDGMSGVITPAPHGSLAIIMQGNENVDSVAQEVQQSIHWLP